MHIKHIHCMIEKLAECAKCEVEKGIEQLDTEEMGKVTDMLKDLCEAEYYARMAKCLEEKEKEDEEEEKYLLKRLKEEYGEEEGERRYYDSYRYANGRFAPKGRGTYRSRGGRRGYEETPYMMTPEMYHMYPAEYYRDMDRMDGKMYYTEPSMNRSVGNYGSSTNWTGNMAGMRDTREGKSGMSRRTYMETKEMNSDNSAESRQAKLKGLENYLSELGADISEMITGASNEEKTMLKTKLQTLAQKIQ